MNDARINFICNDFPDLVEFIQDFPNQQTLDQKLEYIFDEVVNDKVEINTNQKIIILPKLCQTYKDDFGSSDENILRFVFKYFK